MFKTRNVLMMLFVLLFTVAVGCGDDDKKENNNNNQDLNDVRGDQDTGNVDNDTNSEADVEEEGDTIEPPTCTPLSPAIGSGKCDSLCQTGCAAGQACLTGQDSNGLANECVEAGTGEQGDACGQTSGCKAGYICASTSADSPSTCMKYCSPGSSNGPQCDTGTKCNVLIVPNEERLAVCAPLKSDACTIYPNAGCPTDQQCYPNGEGGTQCVSFNKQAKTGDTCKFLNECNENQICGGNPGVCADYCAKPGDDSGCEGDLKCAKIDDSIPYGACIAG